jgi:hypothetical protein
LDAQIVPERDLNHEVQKKMEALTIDALTVEVKTKKDRATRPPRGAFPKSVVTMISLGVCLLLVAIVSAVVASNNKENERVDDGSAPSSPPKTFVPDLEFARSIFAPLSANDTLWDESSPQYKALWWIVHDDPAKMIMTMQDETQSSSSSMIVERYVMALLYFATDGPNWPTHFNFLGNSSICDWNDDTSKLGVQCSDQGATTELELGKCGLTFVCHESFSIFCGPCSAKMAWMRVDSVGMTNRMSNMYFPLSFDSQTLTI